MQMHSLLWSRVGTWCVPLACLSLLACSSEPESAQPRSSGTDAPAATETAQAPQAPVDDTPIDSLLSMERMNRSAAQDYRLAQHFATSLRPEDAFESLADALQKGYDDVTRLREDPLLDALRSDLRWEQVMIYAETNRISPPEPTPAPTSTPRRTMTRQPRQPRTVGAVDVPAPDWTMPDEAGRPVRLQDLRGKVVIMDFWATWCGPCKMSMPQIDRFAREYAGDDVVVLSVNVWDRGRDAALEWWRERDYAMKVVFGDRALTSAYYVGSIPYLCVIDTEGIIRHRETGYHPNILNNLVTWSRELLAES